MLAVAGDKLRKDVFAVASAQRCSTYSTSFLSFFSCFPSSLFSDCWVECSPHALLRLACPVPRAFEASNCRCSSAASFSYSSSSCCCSTSCSSSSSCCCRSFPSSSSSSSSSSRFYHWHGDRALCLLSHSVSSSTTTLAPEGLSSGS